MSNDDFDAFWAKYPKRTPHANPRKAAYDAYHRALKRGVKPEDLQAGVEGYVRYVAQFRVQPIYVCMTTTWLNQDRHENYIDFGTAGTGADLAREILLG